MTDKKEGGGGATTTRRRRKATELPVCPRCQARTAKLNPTFGVCTKCIIPERVDRLSVTLAGIAEPLLVQSMTDENEQGLLWDLIEQGRIPHRRGGRASNGGDEVWVDPGAVVDGR